MAADSIFNVVAEADGFYPVRLLWYEGGGGANGEFFSVDDKGKKILINIWVVVERKRLKKILIYY